jgi:2-dehydro-3-deoxygluconokinase
MTSAMKTVTFGEIMLRLSPPGFERFFQSPVLQATFGGGEANVAVSLAHFGLESYYVSRVPANPIGDGAIRALRAEGVRTEFVQRGGHRLGIYFAEAGASQRASTVVYDRTGASVAAIKPGEIAWNEVFAGAGWFHVTGITPALGPGLADTTREALATAREAGARISMDLNYRAKLWTKERAREAMRPLAAMVDLLIANEEDIQACLGLDVHGADIVGGQLDVTGYRDVAARVAREFGVKQVAITLRESHSASRNGWSAIIYDGPTGGVFQSPHYEVTLVDRIGGGDSFAAGLIYALATGRAPEPALRFAVAASALKQTIPGDFNRVTAAEVDRLALGDQSGRVQR